MLAVVVALRVIECFNQDLKSLLFLTINKSFLRDLHSACCVPLDNFAQGNKLPCFDGDKRDVICLGMIDYSSVLL